VTDALVRDEVVDAGSISALATGASFLGTGGGGDPRIGELMARAALREHGPVELRDVDAVTDEDLVVPVAMIGAPTVILERIPGGHEFELTLDRLEQLLERPVSAVMPIEAGGLNSTVPFIVAARRGLPVVDGDGMGRAFPEVQMVTLGAGGVPAWPLVIADESGAHVTVDGCGDNATAERLARAAVVAMGGSAVVAHYAAPGERVRRWAVPGSVRLAIAIGRALQEVSTHGGDALAALGEVCDARREFTGKLTDVDRRTEAGFVRGVFTVDGLGPDAGSRAEVAFQNENLLLHVDGALVTAVPDLITLVDAESGRPLTTEGARFGARVHVVSAPASEVWWRPEALPLVSPRAFGYDLDPVRRERGR
jgi:uncharacterized protein